MLMATLQHVFEARRNRSSGPPTESIATIIQDWCAVEECFPTVACRLPLVAKSKPYPASVAGMFRSLLPTQADL
jgi:hypothetical protein